MAGRYRKRTSLQHLVRCFGTRFPESKRPQRGAAVWLLLWPRLSVCFPLALRANGVQLEATPGKPSYKRNPERRERNCDESRRGAGVAKGSQAGRRESEGLA